MSHHYRMQKQIPRQSGSSSVCRVGHRGNNFPIMAVITSGPYHLGCLSMKSCVARVLDDAGFLLTRQPFTVKHCLKKNISDCHMPLSRQWLGKFYKENVPFQLRFMAACKSCWPAVKDVNPPSSHKMKLASCVGFVWRGSAHKQTTRELQQDVYGDVR